MAGRELDPADISTTGPWLVRSDSEPDTAMPSFELGPNEEQGHRRYLIRQAWPMEPGGSIPLATGIQRLADARVMAASPDLADTLLRLLISPELNREGIEPHTRQARDAAWDLLVRVTPHLEIGASP